MKNNARTLHGKSISSMRTAMAAFNSPSNEGRATSVLLHMQHAFEMLLKAALVQGSRKVFDKQTGRSIGFEGALNQCQQLPGVKLTTEEAGTLRAIDALRDDEQHWFNQVSEGLLYLHARAGVTLFDEVLHRAFKQRLADHLPVRVLPVSTEAPQDFIALVDSEFKTIAGLLKPGRRARGDARARIRALLALESHVSEDTRVSDTDVNRVEKGIKEGKSRAQIFPRLGQVGAEVDGDGVTVKVKFVKTGDAMPVHFVSGDENVDTAAIRDVDMRNKFHWSPRDLAGKLGLSTLKASALRDHLGIDHDDDCLYVFQFDSQSHPRYSDNAYTKMRDALTELDLDAVWESHSKIKRNKPRPPCTQPGCSRQKVRAAS